MISRPLESEMPTYFDRYIHLANTDDLLRSLKSEMRDTQKSISQYSSAVIDYRYAAGKWNLKEILVHLVDTERILAYRALRIARQDATPLSGFDENAYVEHSNACQRPIRDILKEYKAVRKSTIQLFSSFTPQMLDYRGTASKVEISVRALGFAILGHEIHHKKVFEERYLKAV